VPPPAAPAGVPPPGGKRPGRSSDRKAAGVSFAPGPVTESFTDTDMDSFAGPVTEQLDKTTGAEMTTVGRCRLAL